MIHIITVTNFFVMIVKSVSVLKMFTRCGQKMVRKPLEMYSRKGNFDSNTLKELFLFQISFLIPCITHFSFSNILFNLQVFAYLLWYFEWLVSSFTP